MRGSPPAARRKKDDQKVNPLGYAKHGIPKEERAHARLRRLTAWEKEGALIGGTLLRACFKRRWEDKED